VSRLLSANDRHIAEKRNMTKRRWLLLGLSAGMLLLSVGGVLYWLLTPRTSITQENFERIQIGMTAAEVHEILGGPPRNETRQIFVEPGNWWRSNEIWILVAYRDGRVIRKDSGNPWARSGRSPWG
jgi:hypothetical protein